jgi:hypothetical protein
MINQPSRAGQLVKLRPEIIMKAIAGYRETVELIKQNPVFSRKPRLVAALEAATAGPWEFVQNLGGAADDSMRGFGPTAQSWRCGNVVIRDDNCFPLLIAVEQDGKTWMPVTLTRLENGKYISRSAWCSSHQYSDFDFETVD